MIWKHMAVIAVLGSLVPIDYGVVRAGNLEPPGPPAPTMKTLQEVEPRTPVQSLAGDANALHVIAQSGSYYLTGDITGVSGKHGIEINADNVTIDLGGYSLSGGPGSLNGITDAAMNKNINIRNGAVTGWNAGIVTEQASNVVIEDVRVSDNTAFGISLGAKSLARNCLSINNGNEGIKALSGGATITACKASGSSVSSGIIVGSNSLVTDCTAENNGLHGIEATGSTIRGCLVVNNGRHGILIGSNSAVIDNHAVSNGTNFAIGAGINVSGSDNRIDGNNVILNDRGIFTSIGGNVIIRNTSRDNGAAGPADEYLPAAGNDVGPIGSAATATSPWANIVY